MTLDAQRSLHHFHPALVALYGGVLVVLAMTLFHPAFVVVGVVASAVLLVAVCGGRSALRQMRWYPGMVLLLTLFNAVFDSAGVTVLVRYGAAWGWGPSGPTGAALGRALTGEALLYGLLLAGLMVTVLNLCVVLAALLGSDGLVALGARFLPAVTLLFSLILRFLPLQRRRLTTITEAALRPQTPFVIFTALFGQASEHAVTTADAMRARGFIPTRTGTRSSFMQRPWTVRDRVAGLLGLALAVPVIVLGLRGAVRTSVIPVFRAAPLTGATAVALTCYLLLLIMPTLVVGGKGLRCTISLSRN